MDDKQYRNALVIFLDILGSQDRESFDDLFRINTIFHDQMEHNKRQDKAHTVYERHVYTFSDCSYIIYDYKDGIEESRKDLQQLINIALYNTQTLIQRFLFEGFLCRGGIAYGDVYYEKERSLLFGPAINCAYTLEDKKAVYPRVLIDEYAAKQVLDYNANLLKNAISEEHRRQIGEINGQIVLHDEDGFFHLNYLCSVKQGLDYLHDQELLTRLTVLVETQLFEQAKKLEQCSSEDRKRIERIIAKYKWLQKYVDASAPIQNLGSTQSYYTIL